MTTEQGYVRTSAQYIEEEIGAGVLLGSPHFSVQVVQRSYDEERVHVVLHVYTNHCGALLDALQRLSQLGLTVTGLHRLHGRYEGDIEIDVIVNPKPARKRPITRPGERNADDIMGHVPMDDLQF